MGHGSSTPGNIGSDGSDSETSLALLDDAIGTIDAAAPTAAIMAGAKAVDGVATEMDDGDIGNLTTDLFQRLVLAAHDFGTGSLQTTPLSEAARNTQETPFAMIEAVGATPAVNVENFNDHTFMLSVANFDTSLTLNIQASVDGTTYTPISVDGDPDNVKALCAVAAEIITITGNGDFPIRLRGAFHSLKAAIATSGGAASTDMTAVYRGAR